jgi:hypothetical protein
VTGKQFYAIASLLGALLSVAAPAFAASAAGAASASIQATAHVEAPLGLTELSACDPGFDTNVELNEPLFWLYRPRGEGVKILIETGGDTPGATEHIVSAQCIVPNTVLEYSLAALVDLTEYVRASENDAALITLTVIFVDN